MEKINFLPIVNNNEIKVYKVGYGKEFWQQYEMVKAKYAKMIVKRFENVRFTKDNTPTIPFSNDYDLVRAIPLKETDKGLYTVGANLRMGTGFRKGINQVFFSDSAIIDLGYLDNYIQEDVLNGKSKEMMLNDLSLLLKNIVCIEEEEFLNLKVVKAAYNNSGYLSELEISIEDLLNNSQTKNLKRKA